MKTIIVVSDDEDFNYVVSLALREQFKDTVGLKSYVSIISLFGSTAGTLDSGEMIIIYYKGSYFSRSFGRDLQIQIDAIRDRLPGAKIIGSSVYADLEQFFLDAGVDCFLSGVRDFRNKLIETVLTMM